MSSESVRRWRRWAGSHPSRPDRGWRRRLVARSVGSSGPDRCHALPARPSAMIAPSPLMPIRSSMTIGKGPVTRARSLGRPFLRAAQDPALVRCHGHELGEVRVAPVSEALAEADLDDLDVGVNQHEVEDEVRERHAPKTCRPGWSSGRSRTGRRRPARAPAGGSPRAPVRAIASCRHTHNGSTRLPASSPKRHGSRLQQGGECQTGEIPRRACPRAKRRAQDDIRA
jgi:hypothetical protein